jgi:hypothetical protein
MTKKIYFLPNGMTEVFDEGRRCPELERRGEYPPDFTLYFPGGMQGRIFRTDDGTWDWTRG